MVNLRRAILIISLVFWGGIWGCSSNAYEKYVHSNNKPDMEKLEPDSVDFKVKNIDGYLHYITINKCPGIRYQASGLMGSETGCVRYVAILSKYKNVTFSKNHVKLNSNEHYVLAYNMYQTNTMLNLYNRFTKFKDLGDFLLENKEFDLVPSAFHSLVPESNFLPNKEIRECNTNEYKDMIHTICKVENLQFFSMSMPVTYFNYQAGRGELPIIKSGKTADFAWIISSKTQFWKSKPAIIEKLNQE